MLLATTHGCIICPVSWAHMDTLVISRNEWRPFMERLRRFATAGVAACGVVFASGAASAEDISGIIVQNVDAFGRPRAWSVM